MRAIIALLVVAIIGLVLFAVLSGPTVQQPPAAPSQACAVQNILVLDRTSRLGDSRVRFESGIARLVDSDFLAGPVSFLEVRDSTIGYEVLREDTLPPAAPRPRAEPPEICVPPWALTPIQKTVTPTTLAWLGTTRDKRIT